MKNAVPESLYEKKTCTSYPCKFLTTTNGTVRAIDIIDLFINHNSL